MSVTITMEGTGELSARINAYKKGLRVAGIDLTYQVARDIETIARDLVAKDTERTAQNIDAERTNFGAMVVATRGGERDIVPALLELGTWKMAPRPFMKPAGEMAMAAGATKKAIREVGGLLKAAGRIG